MFRRLLQAPGAKRNPYSRPDDPWICGRTGEPCGACRLGPDAKGRCKAEGQCRPARQGEGWACTRPEAAGGKCAEQPGQDGVCCLVADPCTPRRSLRSWRGRLFVAVGAATLGLLLICLTVPGRREGLMSPGHLASAHSASTMSCADCHSPDTVDFRVATGGIDSLRLRGLADGKNCLSCHKIGPEPFLAHGVAVADFHVGRGTGASTGGQTLAAARAFGLAPKAGAPIACQTCHTEHRGLHADLKAMSSQQCQVCHQNTFASLAVGHPEFGAFPYGRRTRIQFDHTRHLLTHFVDSAVHAFAPKNCASCHEPTADGRKMLVRGFEAACSACHAGQIAGVGRADDPGLVVLRVPGLDAKSLQSAGLDVGEWPGFAEGKLTPLMEVMLSTRADVASALKTLRGANWLELENAPRARLEAAALVAWATKDLFYQLLMGGQDAFLAQAGVVARGVAPADLVAGLPMDTLMAAQKAWFPNLAADVAAHRAGLRPVSTLPNPLSPLKPAPGIAPVVASAPGPATKSGGDDLLGDDLLAEPAKVAKPVAAAASGDDDLLGDAPVKAVSGSALAPGVAKLPAPAPIPPADRWTQYGGWYRQDATFTLHYRPTGHGDAFLQRWIEQTGLTISPSVSPDGMPSASDALFAQLTSEKAPGLCVKCHAPEATPRGGIALPWQGSRPDPVQRGHTLFSHRAHFSLMDDRGCQTCHQLNTSAPYAAAFAKGQTSPAVFRSNFQPMTKTICAACHQNGVVSDSCTTCHTYHAGKLETHFTPAAFNTDPGKP